jgi:hypothetical protein
MLYMPNSSLFDSEEAVLSKSAVISAEGQALVALADGLAPSTGAAGEVFAGFVCQRVSAAPILEEVFTRVEVLTVANEGSLSLTRAPISDAVVGLYDVDGGKAIEGTTLVDGVTIANEGLKAGLNVKVTYKYKLTVVEAKSIMGDAQPGGTGGALVGQIGVVSRGTVFTTCYDTSVDWASAKELKLGADGVITSGSDKEGTVINGYVVANGIPSAMYPYLGIKFSAA